VPERMPTPMVDADSLPCRNEDVALQDGCVPHTASIGVRENPTFPHLRTLYRWEVDCGGVLTPSLIPDSAVQHLLASLCGEPQGFGRPMLP